MLEKELRDAYASVLEWLKNSLEDCPSSAARISAMPGEASRETDMSMFRVYRNSRYIGTMLENIALELAPTLCDKGDIVSVMTDEDFDSWYYYADEYVHVEYTFFHTGSHVLCFTGETHSSYQESEPGESSRPPRRNTFRKPWGYRSLFAGARREYKRCAKRRERQQGKEIISEYLL